MANRARDWLDQAERDLEVAERNRAEGYHEWACFAAQQAAEKAVKAMHQVRGQEAWGHVVADLLDDLGTALPDGLRDRALVLDNYYIPTRYADSHPGGAPFTHYGALQSGDAVRYAGEILDYARLQVAGPGRG